MNEVTITTLPQAPLFALEIWGNLPQAGERLRKAIGCALPKLGHSLKKPGLRLIRFEPTVWLVEGDATSLQAALGSDGSLTAIGGGIVRVALRGPGWRSLLMEHGVFDAESTAFAPGCSAATLIDQINVRLLVESEDECIAFVPRSYAADVLHFWQVAATALC